MNSLTKLADTTHSSKEKLHIITKSFQHPNPTAFRGRCPQFPGRWCRLFGPMLPSSTVFPTPPSKEAVLALLGRRGRPERQPSLPPFAGRLCRSKSVTDSRTPSAPLAPAARLPHFKGKAVARLSTAPRSGCLPLPFLPRPRSRGETCHLIPLPASPRGGE